jgi:hypothetical protein
LVCDFFFNLLMLSKDEVYIDQSGNIYIDQSGNTKLVFKVIFDQDIYRLYNGDRIFCLDKDMSIIVFEK